LVSFSYVYLFVSLCVHLHVCLLLVAAGMYLLIKFMINMWFRLDVCIELCICVDLYI